MQSTADPFHSTAHGAIFAADCMKVLPLLKDEVVDTVFADPPFNLGKEYGKNTDDSLPDERYVRWCQEWLAECVRVLKPGGSLFLYNLPKWNILLGAYPSGTRPPVPPLDRHRNERQPADTGPTASKPLQPALL